MDKSILLVLVFIFGCVTAKWVPLEIPKATASGPKVENWCVTVNQAIGVRGLSLWSEGDQDWKSWNDFLKSVNREGWEIVTVSSVPVNNLFGACFRREK